VADLMVAGSGERDRCLRRGVGSLRADLCVRLAAAFMKRMGFTGWLEDLSEVNEDGFG